MKDLKEILMEICEDERVLDSSIDLLESGILDSFAFIELFSYLEDEGIELQPTRIDRNSLRSIDGIQKLIDDYLKSKQHNRDRNELKYTDVLIVTLQKKT